MNARTLRERRNAITGGGSSFGAACATIVRAEQAGRHLERAVDVHNMFSIRFQRRVTVSAHARMRMAERAISDATEQAVQLAVARMKTGKRISHEAAMQQLDHLIEQHGRNKKKAD
ncbi:MAG: hypothetical protein FD134_1627 [Gallionellaceae bacterium]|nr:MAG: hypothetical protein FD134_1627 [Gallionellaceae bacterium]